MNFLKTSYVLKESKYETMKNKIFILNKRHQWNWKRIGTFEKYSRKVLSNIEGRLSDKEKFIKRLKEIFVTFRVIFNQQWNWE